MYLILINLKTKIFFTNKLMSIKIIINTPKTKAEGITITVQLSDTVSTAKETYYKLAGTRANNQWLYDGAVLKDNQNFETIGIENLDLIEAHPSSKGGRSCININS